MATIHFLNVLEGDCNIIQHDSGRTTVIDISNGYNDYDTAEEIAVKNSQIRKDMYLRTQVPSDKKDYKQKSTPDNPIFYLKQKGIKNIFRFIISHPDMDQVRFLWRQSILPVYCPDIWGNGGCGSCYN
jgi:competence protein ComEC